MLVKINNNYVRWSISTLLATLILFGTFHSIFSILAFILFVFLLVFFEKESIIYQVFFVLPLASIFKLSPSSQSFFTIVILLYVLLHFVLTRKATLLLVVFTIYVLIGQVVGDAFELNRMIKLIFNLLFLSSVLNNRVDINHKEVYFSFIIGNLVSSLFGLMDSNFFRIETFVQAKALSANIAENIDRFSGLYADPNYYAIGIIISLCLVVILNHNNEINKFFAIGFSVAAVYFLIQTYSKSAVFMLALPLMALLYSLKIKKKYLLCISILVIAIIIVILAWTGYIPALDLVVERIKLSETASGDTDLNKLTTGRFDIWLMYLKFFVNNFSYALFGSGINAALVEGHAAHNTYIDVIYHLGVVGGSILIYLLVVILKQSKREIFNRNFLNYSVLICLVIMYFFLSELFYFDPPFQIFLAIMVLNHSEKKKENFT